MTVADLVRTDFAPPAVARVELAASGRRAFQGSWVTRYRGVLILSELLVAVLVPLVITGAVLGQPQSSLVLGLPIGWLAVGALCGSYDGDVLASVAHELRKVLLTTVGLLAALPVFGFVTGQRGSEDVALGAVVGTAAAVVAVRGVARGQLRRMRRAGSCTQRVVVAGDPDLAEGLVRRMHASTGAVVKPVALALPEGSRDIGDLLGLPVLGGLEEPDELVAAAIAHGVDAVLLAPGPATDPATMRRFARDCEWSGIPLLIAPGVVDVAEGAPAIPVAGMPVFRVPRPGPAGVGRIVKEAMDRLGAGAGLLLIAPILAAVALAVRLDSPGPAVFRQRRIGANGRAFTMYKFRTMRVDAEHSLSALLEHNETDGPLFKMRNDPRVTRVGRMLRRCSLDELPQLANVVRGQMSLVGPRPPLEHEVAQYAVAERRRLLVKPGLTGLSQVSGRSHLSWEQSVRLDLGYVESWSVPLDLRILAQTVPSVLRRHGAF